MAADVLNTDDTIDSRDVIARVEELESDIESWNEDIDEHETNMSDLEEEISEAEAEAQELDDDKDADEIEQIENNIRSEERRVGTECRSRWSADH